MIMRTLSPIFKLSGIVKSMSLALLSYMSRKMTRPSIAPSIISRLPSSTPLLNRTVSSALLRRNFQSICDVPNNGMSQLFRDSMVSIIYSKALAMQYGINSSIFFIDIFIRLSILFVSLWCHLKTPGSIY